MSSHACPAAYSSATTLRSRLAPRPQSRRIRGRGLAVAERGGHARAGQERTARHWRWLAFAAAGLAVVLALLVLGAAAAHAAPIDPRDPTDPTPPTGPLDITVNGEPTAPSTSVVVLLGITLLSVAPSLLLMMTSFTKLFVVLALTRNALGLQGVPPNQVLAGLSLFLSIFIMFPVLGDINGAAVQPYLAGDLTFTDALGAASDPLRTFMLGQTREEDIALLTRAADLPNPASPEVVPLQTLIPAFMLSELRAAFVIGFVIFVPFLVIDLVVSAVLMSMGMMMLPPVMISLPFKILLFVLVDGWGLIVTTLVGSY
ncbi:flagellar type III secretion system pore protein FliP [Georgenia thermotolerans]|uniref:Flagellar biosynthetic protein FliP n=1 Tax=Georgenia thermotolerans TaxID=527326 RepID=A0A7J5UM95_9MICO|nr:flagellar type III secretion system pore protein FliP [Georgenia thermotolerans]